MESENWYKQIFEYICIKILLRTNIRIYSYPKSWHERISEYIRIQKMIWTNIRINIWIKNIQIFKYSNIFVTLWKEPCLALAFFKVQFPAPFLCFCSRPPWNMTINCKVYTYSLLLWACHMTSRPTLSSSVFISSANLVCTATSYTWVESSVLQNL